MRHSQALTIEMDITPERWLGSAAAIGAGIAAAISTLMVKEVRATRSALIVMMVLPCDDLPLALIEGRRRALCELVTKAMAKADAA